MTEHVTAQTFPAALVCDDVPLKDSDGSVIGTVNIDRHGVAYATLFDGVKLPQKFVGASIGSKPR